MTKDIAIVHFNTPELTNAEIRSVWKHTPDARITVFDNSDRRPFPKRETDRLRVLDNTQGQLVDFDAMLARYPGKIPTACNWGSEKHIASVDYLFDTFPEGFLLMDSDVLVRRDISSLFDQSVAWAGAIEGQPKFWFQAIRLFPFLLWINVPMCKAKGIRFFHEGYVYKMSHGDGPPYYDTGGSFYRDCTEALLPHREINLDEYVVHLGGASCYPTQWVEWLVQYKDLYE